MKNKSDGLVLSTLSTYRTAVYGATMYVVPNASLCDAFDHLIGAREQIDGVERLVVAVERRAHMPAYVRGEPIRLLLAPERSTEALLDESLLRERECVRCGGS